MTMYKVPTPEEKAQVELQKQSFIANTRLQLSEKLLNTIVGRPDFDVTAEGAKESAVEMLVDYATQLMLKLGMVVLTHVE